MQLAPQLTGDRLSGAWLVDPESEEAAATLANLFAGVAVLAVGEEADVVKRTPVPRVDVALPGVDPVEASPPHRSAAGGTSFLCVAAVHPGKGHDLLFDALAALGDRAWTLTCVGSLDVDPDYVSRLQTQVYARSWERRVIFTGPLSGRALGAAYGVADLLDSDPTETS